MSCSQDTAHPAPSRSPISKVRHPNIKTTRPPPMKTQFQLVPGAPTIQDQHQGSKIQVQKNLQLVHRVSKARLVSIYARGFCSLDTRQSHLAGAVSLSWLSLQPELYCRLLLLPLQIIPHRQPRHHHLTRGSLKYMSRRSSMVNHRFLNPSVC